MNRNQLQWLDEPASELRSQPIGTLIVARTPSDVIHLAEIMEREPDDSVIKYRRFPDCRVLSIADMSTRGVKFALLA